MKSKKIFIGIMVVAVIVSIFVTPSYLKSSEKKEVQNYFDEMYEVVRLEIELVEKLNTYLNNPTEQAETEVELVFKQWSDKLDKVGENIDNQKIKNVHNSYKLYRDKFHVYMGSGYEEELLQVCIDAGLEVNDKINELAKEYGLDYQSE